VGLRRLVEQRARIGRGDVAIRVRSWPLEVVNHAPLDPQFIAAEIDELKHGVAPDLFTGFRAELFPATSLPALSLVAAGYESGLGVGEAISLELRDLLFERGVDISRIDALGPVAQRHRVVFDPTDTSAVLADHAEGVRRGVIGSPHFFTPEGSFFCPALDIRRDDRGHLSITADPEGFERFLATCFV
jgi:hypothetical protein